MSPLGLSTTEPLRPAHSRTGLLLVPLPAGDALRSSRLSRNGVCREAEQELTRRSDKLARRRRELPQGELAVSRIHARLAL